MKTLICILSALVVFWNVENFFETRPFFGRKCNSIAKTLLMIAEEEGRLPDAIGLAEVENRRALQKLLSRTALWKYGYKIVHYDSPDHRGIDCALLYRPSSFHLTASRSVHILDSTGNIIPTRDILVAESDSLVILVNHHPSKVGGKQGEVRRAAAMQQMIRICDSLECQGRHNILCIGDFNANLWGKFSQGTIKYNGEWDKIDGHFQRGLAVSERVFTAPHLTTADKAFGGTKPFRSWSGPRYTGGVSDHYPIVLHIKKSD